MVGFGGNGSGAVVESGHGRMDEASEWVIHGVAGLCAGRLRVTDAPLVELFTNAVRGGGDDRVHEFQDDIGAMLVGVPLLHQQTPCSADVSVRCYQQLWP